MENVLQRIKLPGVAALILFLAISVGFGQLPQVIQDRMLERLPRVDRLKQEQMAGENNAGFLEALKVLDAEQRGVVNDENQDRRRVYGILAARTRVDPVQVGVARAGQIAERSTSGVMLQTQRGEWVEKD